MQGMTLQESEEKKVTKIKIAYRPVASAISCYDSVIAGHLNGTDTLNCFHFTYTITGASCKKSRGRLLRCDDTQ